MFDVSFSELMLIGVIALIVIGPERLPKVARTIGHLVGRAQRYVSDVKSDIQREMDLEELNSLKGQMEEAAKSVKSSMQDASESLREPMDEARKALADASDSIDSLTKAAESDAETASDAHDEHAAAKTAPADVTPDPLGTLAPAHSYETPDEFAPRADAGAPDSGPEPAPSTDSDPDSLPLPGFETGTAAKPSPEKQS